jgi:hypothetical protein
MRTTQIRRTVAGTAAALVAFAGMSALTASPAFAATSQVSVVHGIPGQPVDVYVNGKKTLDDFEPGKVAGPLTLPEGDYDIALTKPGEPIADAILTVDDAAVPGGANITPKEAKADLPAGTVSADVVLAGTDTVVLGPTDLDLKEGTATIVYAIGSAEDKTLAVVAQTITGLHSAPGGVPSGSGGMAGTGVTTWWYVFAAFGMLLLLGGATRFAVVRRTR